MQSKTFPRVTQADRAAACCAAAPDGEVFAREVAAAGAEMTRAFDSGPGLDRRVRQEKAGLDAQARGQAPPYLSSTIIFLETKSAARISYM